MYEGTYKNGTMKILLGNNTLALLAGSETWTLTLAKQLKKMGHHVACYAPTLGIISQKLEEEGIHCYDSLASKGILPFSPYFIEPVDHTYDVIMANHFHVVEYLREAFPKTPIIATIHGIMHFNTDGTKAPEHPAMTSGVNQFVSVSEEVQEKLKEEYNLDSIVIRNFFDLPYFSDIKPRNEKPQRILLNTNYAQKDDPEIQIVRDAAKILGLNVAAIGENFNQTPDIKRALTDSDIVIGMGRSVLEGVVAGRLGIVHGRWGTGGVITESNIPLLRSFNYSGRNNKDSFATAEELAEMIEKYYMPNIIDDARKMIRSEHSAAFAAKAYEMLAEELTGAAINKSILSAVAPDARPFRLATP